MDQAVRQKEDRGFSVTRLLKSRARASRNNATFRKTGRILAVMLVILGGLDVISTNASLASGNSEMNPLITSLQIEFGNWWSLPKIMAHLLLAYFILWLPSRRILRAARIVVIGYMAIVSGNFLAAL